MADANSSVRPAQIEDAAYELTNFYIDGQWIAAHGSGTHAIVDPSTEQAFGRLAMGDAIDVDRAVTAARRAFEPYTALSVADRLDLFAAILAAYRARADDLVQAVSHEMGAPIGLARDAHVPAGLRHLEQAAAVLRDYRFDTVAGKMRLTREPIGVCGLITPWNWPLNQLCCKIGPALAAGCTMVLKPSEFAPVSARILAEILDAAGVPPGVFNLIYGDGPTVGAALAAHPQVDMVSFTGSTRAGIAVAQTAAQTVKRVTQELGGKAPYIVFDGADFATAVRHAAVTCFRNSGQSCNVPARLLVPADRLAEAVAIARSVAEAVCVGPPGETSTSMGTVANAGQFAKINGLIETGIREGARLVAGGIGRPEHLAQGYYIRPTVFAGVTPAMTIAREEIFGPVLPIMTFENEADAVAIGNDTPYGLAAYVWSADRAQAQRVARRLRVGMVHINGSRADPDGAFGGYKQSGNGREWGQFGFEEFLEVKSMFGYEPKQLSGLGK